MHRDVEWNNINKLWSPTIIVLHDLHGEKYQSLGMSVVNQTVKVDMTTIEGIYLLDFIAHINRRVTLQPKIELISQEKSNQQKVCLREKQYQLYTTLDRNAQEALDNL